ncbi:MAG: T9SS type A sorting domain-containing protein [candidate division Zixibacteria bacterium]|nr:T9SS type A sorting domain-containing protein [candidate division Zixibacteria bacterium]
MKNHKPLLPVSLFFIALLTISVCSAQTPLDVGNTKQLFIDDYFLADTTNVSFTVNPPQCLGPVVLPDNPWENWSLSYFNIMDDGGTYKMWYGCWEWPSRTRRICYATSPNGVTWDKPNLGLVEFQGSYDNNILPVVFDDGGTVFIDPLAPDEARYKITGNNPYPYIYNSSDGINFTLVDSALLDMMPDSHNPMFYDTRLDKYVAYLRSWNFLPDYDSEAIPNRTVSRVEMLDPISFWEYPPVDTHFYKFGDTRPPAISDELDIVMTLDSLDPPDADIYTSGIIQYMDNNAVYFAFPSLNYHYPEPPTGEFYNDGILNIQLAVSRDGLNWKRYRTPYIDNAACGDSLRQMYIGLGLLKINDSLYQYLYGVEETHGDSLKTSAYYRFGQRLDGFVSLDAGFSVGSAETVPISFSGNSLDINYETSGNGYVLCELLDENGLVIPGFSKDDADTLRGSETTSHASWNGLRNIESLQGTTIKLRWEIQDAKIYSFQFINDPALDVDDNIIIPELLSLSQNYPNPFNPTTRIEYHLTRGGFISLTVFNLSGQVIKSLINKRQPAGTHVAKWDGSNDSGQPVASGIYLYEISSDAKRIAKKMVLIK